MLLILLDAIEHAASFSPTGAVPGNTAGMAAIPSFLPGYGKVLL
jgi:hypothetical protein